MYPQVTDLKDWSQEKQKHNYKLIEVKMEELIKVTFEKVKGMSYSEYELFVQYLTRQVKHNLKLTD